MVEVAGTYVRNIWHGCLDMFVYQMNKVSWVSHSRWYFILLYDVKMLFNQSLQYKSLNFILTFLDIQVRIPDLDVHVCGAIRIATDFYYSQSMTLMCLCLGQDCQPRPYVNDFIWIISIVYFFLHIRWCIDLLSFYPSSSGCWRQSCRYYFSIRYDNFLSFHYDC